jgi:hypothetical protein
VQKKCRGAGDRLQLCRSHFGGNCGLGGHCGVKKRLCLRRFWRVFFVFWLFISQYSELVAHIGCKKHAWVRGIGCGCAGAGVGKTVATRTIVESKMDFTGPL